MSRFKLGEIVRYSPEGCSALFRITSITGEHTNNPRYYGEHVLGGTEGRYEDQLYKASNTDLEFWRNKKTPPKEAKPKVVCLCGSTKFKEGFEEANRSLTLKGEIVLSVGFFMHRDKEKITEKQKKDLDSLHKSKIDLADYIMVIDEFGYIGESTRSEIEYAEAKGKPVYFWSWFHVTH